MAVIHADKMFRSLPNPLDIEDFILLVPLWPLPPDYSEVVGQKYPLRQGLLGDLL